MKTVVVRNIPMIDHMEHAVTLSEATTLALFRPIYVRLREQAGNEINSCDEISTYSTPICRSLSLETYLTESCGTLRKVWGNTGLSPWPEKE